VLPYPRVSVVKYTVIDKRTVTPAKAGDQNASKCLHRCFHRNDEGGISDT